MELKQRAYHNWRIGQCARYVGPVEELKDAVGRCTARLNRQVHIDFGPSIGIRSCAAVHLEAIPRKLWPNVEAGQAMFPGHKIIWEASLNPEVNDVSD